MVTLAHGRGQRWAILWPPIPSIGIVESQASILVSVSVSLKKYGIAHLCIGTIHKSGGIFIEIIL